MASEYSSLSAIKIKKARAWKRPDTGFWYVLRGRKGKIKVGPDKKAAEFLANKISGQDVQRVAGLIPKDDPSLIRKPSIEGLEEFFAYLYPSRNHFRISPRKMDLKESSLWSGTGVGAQACGSRASPALE